MTEEKKTDKSYYELKQEEKKAKQPQAVPTGQSAPGGKPAPGSVEYEVKGIGWNIKGVLKELQELNSTMHSVANLLEEIKRKLPE